VTVETISIEEWLQDMNRGLPGLNATGLEHLKFLWAMMREHSQDAQLKAKIHDAIPNLEKLLGHKPTTFQEEVPAFVKARLKN